MGHQVTKNHIGGVTPGKTRDEPKPTLSLPAMPNGGVKAAKKRSRAGASPPGLVLGGAGREGTEDVVRVRAIRMQRDAPHKRPVKAPDHHRGGISGRPWENVQAANAKNAAGSNPLGLKGFYR